MRSVASSFLLIFFAFIIDALQWIVGWGAFVLGMVAPTVTGGAVGAIYCPTSLTATCTFLGTVAGGAINLIPGVAQAGGAIGTAVGMALAIVISFTLGPLLCWFLWMAGYFNPRYMLPAFVGEVVPFMGFVPAWTGATVASVFTSKVAGAAGGTTVGKLFCAAGATPGATPMLKAATFLRASAPPRDAKEGAERAAQTRTMVLQNLSQGLKNVRPAAPKPREEPQEQYGFAA